MSIKQPVIAYVEHPDHCMRVLKTAEKIARREQAPLWIFTVQRPDLPPDETARTLEAFYAAAKLYNAQLQVFFDNDPTAAALTRLRSAAARHLVVEVPHSLQNAFQGELISPGTFVTMVSENTTVTLPPRSTLRMQSGILQSGLA